MIILVAKIIIVQPPPDRDDTEHGPGTHLLATVRRLAADVVDAHQRQAEMLALSSNELRALDLVAAGGETTAGALATGLGLTTGAVTGILDRLERRGLVRRRQDPDDRRRVLVVPGEGTPAQLAGVPDPLAAAVGDLLAVAPSDQLGTVDRLLSVLDLSLRDELRRLDERHSEPAPEGVLAVAGGPVSHARLVVETGLNKVTMGTASMSDLCRAAFGRGSDVALTETEGTVRLGPARRALFGGWVGAGEITLRAGLRWSLEVAGGSNHWTADLTGVSVESLVLGGGGNRVELLLPAPEGTARVAIGGGVSRCRLRLPAGTPVRLTTRGGANKLQIGDARLGSVGGHLEWESPDFASAADRYEVSVGGGADRLEVVYEVR